MTKTYELLLLDHAGVTLIQHDFVLPEEAMAALMEKPNHDHHGIGQWTLTTVDERAPFRLVIRTVGGVK